MSNIAIVVPARLTSKRFPRKLLHPIQDKPLILWTAERITFQVPDLPLYFAVEDQELFNLLKDRGYQPIITSDQHPCGTDRIAEANEKIQAEFIINVQADEPLVTWSQIKTLSELIQNPNVEMATLATPFQNAEDFNNPDKVKVVFDNQYRALYFSRSMIPFARDYSVLSKVIGCRKIPATGIWDYMPTPRILLTNSEKCHRGVWKKLNAWNSYALWKTVASSRLE